jgi:AraC family transcriptional regulator
VDQRLSPGQFFGSIVQKMEVGNFILSETVYPRGLRVARHSHENAYYCIVLQGSYDQAYGRKSRVSGPLTLEYHPPDELHSAHFPNGDVRSFNIELRPSWLAMLADFPVLLKESADYRGGRPAWLAVRLYQEYRSQDNLTPLAAESLALEMVVDTARRCRVLNRNGPLAWLTRAQELLKARFTYTPRLSAVAAEVGVHPVHLATAFRRYYRCTIGDYLRRLRVEHACRALATSDSSIAEIAISSGFADQSHFTKTFKRLAGMTPGQFRAGVRPS